MKASRVLARARWLAVAGVALVALTVGVSPASSRPSASTGPAAQSATPLGTLTVALGASNPVFALPYIAQSRGYLRKAGLEVKYIENAGAGVTNMVASGQADLGMLGIAAPLLMSRQGRLTTIVYTHAAGGSGGMLVGGKDVTTIQQLRGKRIASIGIGSSTYGFANIYNEKYNLNANIVPYPDNNTAGAALASGQVAAGTGPYDAFAAQITAGNAHILIDTRTQAERTKAGVPNYPEGAVFGLRDTIKEKQRPVVAYVWALNQALAWMRPRSDREVATELLKSEIFRTTFRTVETLTPLVNSLRGYVAPTAGRISAASWPAALNFYAKWGVPGFTASDPLFRYIERVNMGYLNYSLRRDANFKYMPKCKKGQKSTAKKPCFRG